MNFKFLEFIGPELISCIFLYYDKFFLCVFRASSYWDLHLIQELYAIFSKPLEPLLSSKTEVDDVAFTSINSIGTDIRVYIWLCSYAGDYILCSIYFSCDSAYGGYHLKMSMLLNIRGSQDYFLETN
ncbi:hypothetical protein Peur_008888 [Populus x canadensis]